MTTLVLITRLNKIIYLLVGCVNDRGILGLVVLGDKIFTTYILVKIFYYYIQCSIHTWVWETVTNSAWQTQDLKVVCFKTLFLTSATCENNRDFLLNTTIKFIHYNVLPTI